MREPFFAQLERVGVGCDAGIDRGLFRRRRPDGSRLKIRCNFSRPVGSPCEGCIRGCKSRCVGDPWVGSSSGAVRFALTSILSQGERKSPLYHPSGFRSRIGVRGRPSIAGMTSGGPDSRRWGPGRFLGRLVGGRCTGGPASLLTTPLDSGLRRNDEVGGRVDEVGGRIDEGMPRMTNERLREQSIPDRSPGHAFITIAHAGWRRHTEA